VVFGKADISSHISDVLSAQATCGVMMGMVVSRIKKLFFIFIFKQQ
jgi:hypothetical protein